MLDKGKNRERKNMGSKIVWESKISKSMVKDLTDSELGQLIEELDDAVVKVCEDFGVEG